MRLQHPLLKDVYLTYETFIKESKEKQTNKQTFSAPSDWLRLKAQNPIIAKFQVSPGVLLSITNSGGNIGSNWPILIVRVHG